MPSYKRKKVHYKPKSKKNFQNDQTFEIKMKKDNEKKPKTINPPKLIEGKKQKNAFRLKAISIFAAVLLVIYGILYLVFPVGIIESFVSSFKSLGIGKYPIEISGNNVVDAVQNKNGYYVLTNTNLYKFSNGGKQIEDIFHGCSNPVIKSIASRTIIFDQGKEKTDLYINGNKKISNTFDSGVICADIAKNGVYAVASFSKSYDSTVTVFNKKGKSIYSWNCANDYVNSVALSPNGKKMAVSCINSKNGENYTKIHIFDFKSTDSLKTIKYPTDFVYTLASKRSGFYVVYGNGCDFVSWKDRDTVKNSFSYKASSFRPFNSGAVAVFSRNNDQSDNKIAVLNNKGKKLYEFDFNGIITDISVRGKNIYIVSESKILIYKFDGTLIAENNKGNMCRRIIPIGSNDVSAVFDGQIDKINIK